MKQMRHRFKILALFLFILFLILGLYGAWIISNYGTRWFSSVHNPRIAAQKENVTAGDILDRNGIILATTDNSGNRVYQANALSRSACVHVIGDSEGRVANSVETFQAGYLYGFESSLPELASRLFSGDSRRGDTITLTLDSVLNTRIVSSFSSHETTREHNGAAVVMNWQTGEVLGLVSLPVYDPLHITDEVLNSSSKPFWNRATQGKYPPGSTFKLIVTAAALSSLPGINERFFTCTGAFAVDSEHIIHDFAGEIHNHLNLRTAFRVSCNPVFASLATEIGDAALRKQAEKFGFNDNFLFRDLVVENSSYPEEATTKSALAQNGIGQGQLLVTPLHLCMISAGIANNGTAAEPRLLREVQSSAGTERLEWSAEIYRKICSENIAKTLQDYMKAVVQEGGSGYRAAVNGMDIRGKTGTAESSRDGIPVTHGWFTGFCMDFSHPYALCVLVEEIDDGQSGGTSAALIAKDIFEYLKN